MSPDKLRAWVARNRVAAHWLQLRACGIGNEGTYIFQTWPASGLAEDEQDVVQLVFDVSGDYADSIEEDARVAVEFLAEDGETVLASIVHKAKCSSPRSVDAANAANVSNATIISQLLRHIETQQRVLSGGNVGALAAMERVLNLQSKIVEKQALQNAELASKLVEMQRDLAEHADEDATENSAEVSAARARAYDKIGELVPTVGAYIMQYVEHRATNGAAGPAVHAAASTVSGSGH